MIKWENADHTVAWGMTGLTGINTAEVAAKHGAATKVSDLEAMLEGNIGSAALHEMSSIELAEEENDEKLIGQLDYED